MNNLHQWSVVDDVIVSNSLFLMCHNHSIENNRRRRRSMNNVREVQWSMVDDVILFDNFVNDFAHLGQHDNNMENNFEVYHDATIFEENGVNDQDSIECVATTIDEINEIKTESSSNIESNSMCCICLGDLSNGSKIMAQPCSHVFHGDCINKWFNVSKTCPLCRRAIH
ncbi:uncharacterized protein [Cicer arietinum]|uniref:Probable E3 ubiquitin-protein ligase RHY1A n=1 Tax=Cicer arietinum TaxID=3827 RepID=A0A1S2YUB2_CICAR|nr:probable E3 ubiquitin-protein ligase RHY1A [Cicer arietinum]